MNPHTKQAHTSRFSTRSAGACYVVGVNQKYFTTTPLQTKKLGKNLAKEIVKTRGKKRAVVIGLIGDLGGGKTTFLQGFARGLGIRQKALSPTFVIIRKFEIGGSPNLPKFVNFYHIDCYRIKKTKEILGLGFKAIVHNPRNVVAVEWADHIRGIMPRGAIWIEFEFIDEKTRKITVKNSKH